MADVLFAVDQFNTGTASGNVDYTIGGLGFTPKAAIIIGVFGTTTDDAKFADPSQSISVGAATATTNRWCVNGVSADGQGTANVRRNQHSELCVRWVSEGAATMGEADFVSFIANGIRLNWSTAPNTNSTLLIQFFGGTDLSASAEQLTISNGIGNLSSVTGLAFEPDLAFVATMGTIFTNSGQLTSFYTPSFGWAANKTPIRQGALAGRDRDNVTVTETADRYIDTGAAGQLATTTDTATWRGELTAFNSDGVTFTTRDVASGNDAVGLLLLSVGTGDFSVDLITSPNATGTYSITAPGFTPNALILGQGLHTAAGVTADISQCWGMADGTREYSWTSRHVDAVGNTDVTELWKSAIVNVDSGVYDGTFTGFTSSGADLNITTASATAHEWIAVTLGRAEPSGAISGTATLTFTPTSSVTGQTALVAASTLTFTAAGVPDVAGAIAGTATVTFTPTAVGNGLGNVAGAATFTFTAAGVPAVSGDVAGAATLTFTTAGAGQGIGQGVGHADLTFTVTSTVEAVATIAGQATLNFFASAAPSVTVDLVGAAAFAFIATGVAANLWTVIPPTSTIWSEQMRTTTNWTIQ